MNKLALINLVKPKAMKILPISTYRNQPNNKISAPQYSGNFNTNILHSDMFVKTVPSKKLSFGANLTFAEKFVPFRKDFLKYYRENKILTFDEIEKIIQKYLPDMKVRNLAEIQNTGNVHDRTAAYFKNDILITSEMKCETGSQEICLNPQKSDKLEDKITLAQAVIHEMTHAIQENSSDRISKVNWLNKYSGSNQNLQEFIATLQMMPKYYSTVEYNMNFPLSKYMQKINEVPLPVNNAGKREIDNIYVQMKGVPLNTYIDYLIMEIGLHLGIQNFSQKNQKRLLEYLAHVSAKEKEAYANQIDFAKEAMNLKTPVDLDLTRNLYSMFAERCKYWADRVQ